MSSEIETSRRLELDFSKIKDITSSVIPVVVQHVETKDVLILAYVNEESLRMSLNIKEAVFWSTSRNQLWHKGKTSGDFLELMDVMVNCEQNSLVFLVKPKNKGVCHTKNSEGVSRSTCYYRSVKSEDGDLDFTEL
jgi:phosphoribosyl-AMP cyclohydrolase